MIKVFFILLLVLLLAFILFIAVQMFIDPATHKDSQKNRRIAELHNENRILRRITDRLMQENRVIREAAELGLPYPTVEAFDKEETRIKAIIEKELNGSQE